VSAAGAVLIGLALVALLTAIVILAAVVRHAPRPRAAEALARDDLEAAVAAGATGGSAAELVPAAMAARHLGDFVAADRLARAAVRVEPKNGEAWIELALVEAYRGELERAEEALTRAGALRSDLIESVTLHRAWVAMRRGDRTTARRLFDEVEVPLETKLRTDLGSGDAVFADWFLQAAALWRAFEAEDRAVWALTEARRSAPSSRLIEKS